MKKRVSIGFTVLILLGSSLTPANAVFGLSKCEKVKKQIQAEEKIGVASWRVFNNARKQVIANGSTSAAEYEYATELLVPVLESDLVLFQMIQKNVVCFPTDRVVWTRNETVKTKRWLTNMNLFFRSYTSFSDYKKSELDYVGYEFLKVAYPKYGSTVTDKVFSK